MERTETLTPEEQRLALSRFPDWVRTKRVTEVVRLLFEIPVPPDLNAFAQFVIEESPRPIKVPLIGELEVPDPARIVMVGLFPSYAMRSIGSATEISSDSAMLAPFNYWHIMDPDDDNDPTLGESFAGTLLILGVDTTDVGCESSPGEELMPVVQPSSKPLTFGELEEGKRFIAFPVDGDDAGHGGFRSAKYIFMKLRATVGKNGENAVRECDGTLSTMPEGMKILRVE
jgi:hypothetical protein